MLKAIAAHPLPAKVMQLWGIAFIVAAGVLNALQTAMNAQLNKSLGQPALAAPIVFLVGLTGTLVLAPILGAHVHDYVKLGKTPWWAFLGGLCGAVFIYAMLTQTQKIGAGVFVAATVTASIVTSVAIDHFGALGVELHPLGLWRAIGVLLMLGGVALIGKF